MSPSYLLTALTFLPLAGTTALFMLRADDHEWIRRIALAVSLFEFALSLQLLHGFALNSADYQFVEFHNWIPSPPIHYHLGIDGISLFLVLLTTFLTPIAILASWKSIERRVRAFFISLLVLETGMIG
ncbi:MAG: NADH-quinone oxidoreductase subunit M, partial [Acidobacteria bacterium]